MNNTFDNTQWNQESHVSSNSNTVATITNAITTTDATTTTDTYEGFRSSRKRHCPSSSEKKSFIWKYFIEKNNPNGPGKIMVCSLNLANGKPCQKTYTAFSSTSNAIQHLANIHAIVKQEKLHIK
ncbi:4088_t:CDS:1, partial [Ambispora gerdemannii]